MSHLLVLYAISELPSSRIICTNQEIRYIVYVKAANTYAGSFYALGAYSGNFAASLVSDITNETLATTTIQASSVANSWTQFTYELSPSADAGNSNNSFLLTFDATSGDVLQFNLISLFPPTYNDTPNGNRIDLMEALAALNTKHFRIPGGNNLEGNSAPYYWKWNATIGNLRDRPGRPGTWNYENTDGLGLVEYMLWCQDLNLEPVLAVWSGEYLDGTIISEADLAPYVQEALDELEFLMGDASTTYGAQRIALGYEDPFTIKFVEVGNEDNLNGGEDSYIDYRFDAFYGMYHLGPSRPSFQAKEKSLIKLLLQMQSQLLTLIFSSSPLWRI